MATDIISSKIYNLLDELNIPNEDIEMRPRVVEKIIDLIWNNTLKSEITTNANEWCFKCHDIHPPKDKCKYNITDRGGSGANQDSTMRIRKTTAKVRPLLDKLISRKIGQYIEIYQEIIGDLIDSAIDVGSRTSNNPLEIDLNPIKKLLPEFTEAREILKSFLTQSLKEAYKLGKKQPHNTVEGYCCACPYDIVCMEEEIEQRVKKKLIALNQEFKNLKQK